jgi:SAM-dependent methyltransferase
MNQPTVDPAAFNAFEADAWQDAADAYDRFFGNISRRVTDPLLNAAGVREGSRVLDVATGPGYVAGRAAERGAAVTGIDVAPRMIELARSYYPGIEFRAGDAEELPFSNASFDAVIGSFVVLHLGRPEHAARDAARVLVPGGRAAFSMWNTPDRAQVFGLILDAIADAGAKPPEDIPAGPPFFRFSDDDEFAALLLAAGLASLRVETLDFIYNVASSQEIWDGFAGGTARTRWTILKQTAEVQGRIRAALDERMRPYGDGDGFAVPISVKIASGEKA